MKTLVFYFSEKRSKKTFRTLQRFLNRNHITIINVVSVENIKGCLRIEINCILNLKKIIKEITKKSLFCKKLLAVQDVGALDRQEKIIQIKKEYEAIPLITDKEIKKSLNNFIEQIKASKIFIDKKKHNELVNEIKNFNYKK